jgi:predicted nuclease with TOPRIM domain
MAEIVEFLTSPLAIAVLGGGGLLKLLELFFNRSRQVEDTRFLERDNLRKDLRAVRDEVSELREEIADLRERYDNLLEENSSIRTRFYTLKTASMTIVTYIRSHDNLETNEHVETAMQIVEES